MRLVAPLLTLIILSGATFTLGVYAGAKRVWPLPQLKRLVATEVPSLAPTDQFGRLLGYPGKIEITCPIQDEKTAVLLLVGQSNAANYQGQRHQSADDRGVGPLGRTVR